VAPARVARRMLRAVGLPERPGLLVRAVEDGSPASRAGLERGDLFVAAGDRELDGTDPLYAALDGVSSAGGGLTLTVVRGTEEREVEVSFEPTGKAA
jgi:serine protease Do